VAESAVMPGHVGTPAVQRMVEYAPSTGGLALWLLHAERAPASANEVAEPPVSTDGHTLFYGPGFGTLPLAEQAGCVAHGVLHIALRHVQRALELQQVGGDVDLVLFNICADAIVNSSLAHLSWLALPPGAVTLEALLAHTLDIDQPVEQSLLEWDVEALYRAIDDRWASARRGRPDDNAQKRAGGAGRGAPEAGDAAAHAPQAREDGPRAARARALGAGTAPDLRPGPGTGHAPEHEAERAREWSERLLRAHAGDGEHSMLRTLLADLPRVHTPWEQVLRTQLARALAPRPELSWSRPSRSYLAHQGRAGPGRRMPFEPGTAASRAVPRLAVVVDVSGSIDSGLMERFGREIDAILRRQGAGLLLVVGDDAVRRVEPLAPLRGQRTAWSAIEFKGGGGTDFTPLLEEADRYAPDLTVVLTDLDGPARFRPRSPVIWAVTAAHADAVAPFGRKLVLR